MGTEEILAGIRDADMVLVGLGEDFDDRMRLRDCQKYAAGKKYLQESGQHWLIPLWKEYCSAGMGEDVVGPVLEKLADILADKNYFVVSEATDSRIARTPWKKARLVMPCGSTLKKQCTGGCGTEDVGEEERIRLNAFLEELAAGDFRGDLPERFPADGAGGLTECAQCGKAMVLNTVYAEKYNEQGYSEQWQIYMKWLQGTLNRRLLVLELGVGMNFPSVIRWPFERVVYFNQKAFLVRVNEKLYQLAEELSGKGCSIPKNAIAWLESL